MTDLTFTGTAWRLKVFVLIVLAFVSFDNSSYLFSCMRVRCAGEVLSILAKRAVSALPVLRCRPAGRVQYATLRAARVQSHWRQGSLSRSTSSTSSIRLLCFVFSSGRDCLISDTCLVKICCFQSSGRRPSYRHELNLMISYVKPSNGMIFSERLHVTVTFKRMTSKIPKALFFAIFGLHLWLFDHEISP